MRTGWSRAAMPELVQSIIHQIWYNVIWNGNAYTIDFRVFLTITFLLRFGRAGQGDLSWTGGWAGGPDAVCRLTAVRVIRCRMHIHKKLGTQKSSMQPPSPPY